MLLPSYFPFLVFKQENYFFKSNSYFLHLIFAWTKVFVFIDGHTTEGEKSSSRGYESPMGVHCFRKHVLSTCFYENRKKSKEFFHGKRKWKTLGQQYSSSSFRFCVCFRGHSINSSVRYFSQKLIHSKIFVRWKFS